MVSRLLITALCLGALTGVQASPVLELTDTDAAQVLASNSKPVIVDFSATWCGPCKKLKPIFDQLAQELAQEYTFAQVDVDKAPKLAQTHSIMSIPTILVFKQNKVIGKIMGVSDKQELKKRIEELTSTRGPVALGKEELGKRFMVALAQGSAQEIVELIGAGVQVNEPLEDGTLPLAIATAMAGMRGEQGVAMVKTLLDAGAEPHKSMTIRGLTCNSVDATEQVLARIEDSIATYKSILKLLKDHTPFTA